ncbi:MAG: protein involved in polysaccharide export with SLBB domain [Verrucomicrobiales bacterium]|jgi:protein involved in polysaccharide export with SLBB domain
MKTVQSFSPARACLCLFVALLFGLCFNSCGLFRGGDPDDPRGLRRGSSKSLGDYRFQAGSVLNLEVFEGGKSIMTADLEVDAAGNVLVPGVGEISVTGMQPVAAAKKIEFLARKSGQNHLSGPRVHIKALDRRAVVHVSGHVNRSGPVTFYPGLSVEDAIEAAGGADERANAGSIGLTSEGRRKIVTNPATSRLREGDVVNVPRRL